MTDPIRRALRTFVQAFLGSLITSGVLSAASADGVVDWSAVKKAGIAALAAAIVAVFTFVQNWLEDSVGLPAILKAPASDGQEPVPDPLTREEGTRPRDAAGRFAKQGGYIDVGQAIGLVLLILLVVVLLRALHIV